MDDDAVAVAGLDDDDDVVNDDGVDGSVDVDGDDSLDDDGLYLMLLPMP